MAKKLELTAPVSLQGALAVSETASVEGASFLAADAAIKGRLQVGAAVGLPPARLSPPPASIGPSPRSYGRGPGNHGSGLRARVVAPTALEHAVSDALQPLEEAVQQVQAKAAAAVTEAEAHLDEAVSKATAQGSMMPLRGSEGDRSGRDGPRERAGAIAT